jgi:hypothetical protein
MYSASNLFKKAYQYATRHYDKVVILSAKYGLLFPEDEIEPYDLTLNRMSIKQCKEWANNVFEQMTKRLDLEKIRIAYFHAGKRYREYLIPKLELRGVKCIVPLLGLSFGQQLAWYDTHTYLKEMS